ncbi:MAG: dimethylsulfoniopropionate demethylase [Boseongicola sp.]
MQSLSFSRRLRSTPFSAGVEAAGVKAYTNYNHMLLPTVFDSIESDYRHLKDHVQVWDVSCERQVELVGPDADQLMQLLTPRDLRKMKADQCCYVPIVDGAGGMLNDPVAVKRGDNWWWISIADSDLLYWVKGIALGTKQNVSVCEPDVSPLAVQGPKSTELMARVFGDRVRDIRFFRYLLLPFNGTEFVVARSGYSKQGGFEIYVDGSEHGMPLWLALFEAGKDLNVRAGCPNLIERIEGGLLSYGNDVTLDNNPFECGLGKYCNLADDVDCIGKDALKRIRDRGPEREIRPFSLDGPAISNLRDPWTLSFGGQRVGQITSAAWSPDFQTNVSIGMVDKRHRDVGTELDLESPSGPRKATVQNEFWI